MTSMIQLARERQIIEPILEKLEELGLLSAPSYFANSVDKDFDGLIRIKNLEYPIEIKGKLQMIHLPKLLEQKKQLTDLIVVAEIIPEKIKIALRDHKINYMESSGNMLLDLPGSYIFIQDKKEKPFTKKSKDQAFSKKGLVVVFYLLSTPTLINKPQRTIAQVSNTSLDTVNKVLSSLKEQGFVRKKNNKEIRLNQKRELYLKWIDAYENRLKPSLFTNRFRFQNIERELKWHELELKEDSFWGGEPGADLLTNFLKPAKFTLYSTENRAELMKNYRFIPDPKGNIEVYVPFAAGLAFENRTNPLLVYADLINSGDPRNLEVAEKINELYVKRILE